MPASGSARRVFLLAAALLPGSAFASDVKAPLDSSTSSYWTRTYDIPGHYKTLAAVITTKDPPDALRRWQKLLGNMGARGLWLKGYGLTRNGRSGIFPEKEQTAWEIPASSIAVLISTIQSERDLELFRTADVGSSPVDELAGKRAALLRDIAANPSLIDSDSIRTLLEQELQLLNILLKKDAAARKTAAFLLSIEPPGKLPIFPDFPDRRLHLVPVQWVINEDQAVMSNVEVNLSTQPSRFPPGYWARTPPFGSPFGVFNATLEAKDSKEAYNRLLEIRRKFGIEGDAPPPLVSFASGAGMRLEARAGDLPGLRKKLEKLGELTSWMPVNGSSDFFAAAAEKHSLLRADERLFSAPLASAPGVHALLDSEIERLRPYAEAFKAAEGKAEITVFLAQNPR